MGFGREQRRGRERVSVDVCVPLKVLWLSLEWILEQLGQQGGAFSSAVQPHNAQDDDVEGGDNGGFIFGQTVSTRVWGQRFN